MAEGEKIGSEYVRETPEEHLEKLLVGKDLRQQLDQLITMYGTETLRLKPSDERLGVFARKMDEIGRKLKDSSKTAEGLRYEYNRQAKEGVEKTHLEEGIGVKIDQVDRVDTMTNQDITDQYNAAAVTYGEDAPVLEHLARKKIEVRSDDDDSGEDDTTSPLPGPDSEGDDEGETPPSPKSPETLGGGSSRPSSAPRELEGGPPLPVLPGGGEKPPLTEDDENDSEEQDDGDSAAPDPNRFGSNPGQIGGVKLPGRWHSEAGAEGAEVEPSPESLPEPPTGGEPEPAPETTPAPLPEVPSVDVGTKDEPEPAKPEPELAPKPKEDEGEEHPDDNSGEKKPRDTAGGKPPAKKSPVVETGEGREKPKEPEDVAAARERLAEAVKLVEMPGALDSKEQREAARARIALLAEQLNAAEYRNGLELSAVDTALPQTSRSFFSDEVLRRAGDLAELNEDPDTEPVNVQERLERVKVAARRVLAHIPKLRQPSAFLSPQSGKSEPEEAPVKQDFKKQDFKDGLDIPNWVNGGEITLRDKTYLPIERRRSDAVQLNEPLGADAAFETLPEGIGAEDMVASASAPEEASDTRPTEADLAANEAAELARRREQSRPDKTEETYDQLARELDAANTTNDIANRELDEWAASLTDEQRAEAIKKLEAGEVPPVIQAAEDAYAKQFEALSRRDIIGNDQVDTGIAPEQDADEELKRRQEVEQESLAAHLKTRLAFEKDILANVPHTTELSEEIGKLSDAYLEAVRQRVLAELEVERRAHLESPEPETVANEEASETRGIEVKRRIEEIFAKVEEIRAQRATYRQDHGPSSENDDEARQLSEKLLETQGSIGELIQNEGLPYPIADRRYFDKLYAADSVWCKHLDQEKRFDNVRALFGDDVKVAEDFVAETLNATLDALKNDDTLYGKQEAAIASLRQKQTTLETAAIEAQRALQIAEQQYATSEMTAEDERQLTAAYEACFIARRQAREFRFAVFWPAKKARLQVNAPSSQDAKLSEEQRELQTMQSETLTRLVSFYPD